MKYIKFLLLLIISIVTVSSCNLELELTNPNELSPDTFFKNAAQLQSAVNTVYAPFQTIGMWARHSYFMMDNMSGENAGNPQLEADKRQYMNFSFNPSHGAIGDYWEQCYRGINKANFVLDNIDIVENVDATTKARAAGEVKFLRGFYYHLLLNRYGGVPIYTTLSSEGLPRSSVAEVQNQIVADLTEAATTLPDKGSQELGRATSGAAYALLGKVYLFMGNYASANTAFQNVLSGGYSLTDDYSDNYMEETEHNSESIWEITFSSLYGESSWSDNATGTDENTYRDIEYGMSWFNVYPSDELRAAYEAGDSRYADSFYSNGDVVDPSGENQVIGVDFPAIPLTRVAAWKKYQLYYKQTTSTDVSGINFRVIRYADVLLMMAEIENEVGTSAAAIGYLNEVRNRLSVSMPNYGTAAMNATYPVGTKAEIFDAIVHERMVELAGEQIRWDDMLRWGIAASVTAASTQGGAGFTAGKNELFPIPQKEIDSNPSISQTDQNPGY